VNGFTHISAYKFFIYLLSAMQQTQYQPSSYVMLVANDTILQRKLLQIIPIIPQA